VLTATRYVAAESIFEGRLTETGWDVPSPRTVDGTRNGAGWWMGTDRSKRKERGRRRDERKKKSPD
jgi:hypothetical protein